MLSPSTQNPVKCVVSELFAKSCNHVIPLLGSPVPFVAWEKLNCFPKQVVPIQIMGVDISPFDGKYQLAVLIVAPIYHGTKERADVVVVLCFDGLLARLVVSKK